MERKGNIFGLTFSILLLQWVHLNSVDSNNGVRNIRGLKSILNRLSVHYNLKQGSDNQKDSRNDNLLSFNDGSSSNTFASEVSGSDNDNGDISLQTNIRSVHHPNGHPPHIDLEKINGDSSSRQSPSFLGGSRSDTLPSGVGGSDHHNSDISPQANIPSVHHPNGHPPHIDLEKNNGDSSSFHSPSFFGGSSSDTLPSGVGGSDHDIGDIFPQANIPSVHHPNGHPPHIDLEKNNGDSSSFHSPSFFGGSGLDTLPSGVGGSDNDNGNVSSQMKVISIQHPNRHHLHTQPTINREPNTVVEQEKMHDFLSENVCKLPKQKGLCLAYFRKFYFDQDTGKCTAFIYGGCMGNANNFETLEQCKHICEKGAPSNGSVKKQILELVSKR